jgi:hypothetical protein
VNTIYTRLAMAPPGRIWVSLLDLLERRDLRRQRQDFAPEQRDTLGPGRETAPGFSLDGRQRRGAQQIFPGMPNTTMRRATWDPCATCDFWTLKRDSSIKRYPSGVWPKPGPGNRAGFFIARTRGTCADNPASRQGAPCRPLLLRFVEALNTPVVAPVMCLFGGGGIRFFSTRSKR